MKILGIVGTRRSGKTTTITMLIEELKKRGYKVGTIKTINCPVFSMDDPSSNTARHKKAGADFAVARGKGETDISYPRSMGQNEIIDRIKNEDIDYLILEGDLSTGVPRIVCGHKEDDVSPRITEKTFLVSGKIADNKDEVLGLKAISAMKDISALCDCVIENVGESSLPISVDEDTSANTLNCHHACEADKKPEPVVAAKYDLDKLTQRQNTDSVKWDENKDVLPMWVADMDFEAAPAIKTAVLKKALEGIYGYTFLPEGFKEAYINWWDKRHGLKMKEEELLFSKSVLAGISCAVKHLTKNGGRIVLLSPIYNHFYLNIRNNNSEVLESKLVYKDNDYTISYDDLENKLSDATVSAMILCNPHNPTGKIWSKNELEKIGDLCKKHGVLVLSDEIHCDITKPGKSYVPFASVSENCRENSITFIAPTKAFNIAGLDSAAVYVPNKDLRKKMIKALEAGETAMGNAFAGVAAVAAFKDSGKWLDDVNVYIDENRRWAEDFLAKNIPEIKVTKGEATYLMWADISAFGLSSKEFCERLKKEQKVWFAAGDEYGSGGEGFIRINLATQRARVEEGLTRLKRGVETFK
ncbi:MAG: molybdopterin-guanine dinucleotide biosynthesis protein MobB [Eubacterium sp.]|nr:molybdopterin-guanine dinucleotide biosynthesis protein MobB [Eubacterium sp.]